jgi:hypothetical protein
MPHKQHSWQLLNVWQQEQSYPVTRVLQFAWRQSTIIHAPKDKWNPGWLETNKNPLGPHNCLRCKRVSMEHGLSASLFVCLLFDCIFIKHTGKLTKASTHRILLPWVYWYGTWPCGWKLLHMVEPNQIKNSHRIESSARLERQLGGFEPWEKVQVSCFVLHCQRCCLLRTVLTLLGIQLIQHLRVLDDENIP